MKVDKI